MAARTLEVTFIGDARPLQKAMGDVEKSASGLGKHLGDVAKIAGGFVVAQGLLKLPGVLTDLAGKSQQLALEGKKIAIVFGPDLAGDIKDWADQVSGAMGMTSHEAQTMAANMQDLLVPMGFSREAAFALTTETLNLSGALSNWTGGQKSAAEVADLLAKAYLGETDGLKELGIAISAAEIDQRLLANGQKELTGEALNQAKALATQQLIMEKSTDAQKAWAEGGREAAEKSKAFSVTIETLKEKLATTLGPALQEGMVKLGEFATLVGPSIQRFVDAAGPALQKFSEDVKRYWEENIKPAIDNLQAAWEQIDQVVIPILERVGGHVETMGRIIGEVLGIIIDLLGGDFSGAWDRAKEIVRLAKEDVMASINLLKTGAIAAVTAMITGIRELAGMAWDAFNHLGKEMMNGLKAALSATGGFASDVGQAVLEAVKSVVNTVIDSINSKLRFTIDLPFGQSFTVDAPDIPRLAAGGIVTRPTLALIGEAGPEAVIPLSRGGFGQPVTQIVIQGSVYGVDDLARQLDLALKRQGQPGLVTA